jgi:outer membrane protein TolC
VRRPRVRRIAGFAGAVLGIAISAPVHGQTAPPPVIRLTFGEAVERAQEKNPTVAAAAAGIIRAEGLVRQARAATLFQLAGNVTTTTLNRGIDFAGQTVLPQSQVNLALSADMPIVSAAAWARRTQAADTRNVADLSVADVKRQIAFAAADAYLAILAQRRLVESNVLARDAAKAHFDLATELEQKGSGSRLNALRAQQQYSIDEGLVEISHLALYRAQEALGVLIAADGPADASDEPDFTGAATSADTAQAGSLFRADLRLLGAQQQAAERVLRDSSKEWWPSITASFQPATVYPAQLFAPQSSWRFLTQTTVPLFDSASRQSLRIQREATVEESRAALAGASLEAQSQIRAAREAVASGQRSLESAQRAADQARQVQSITNVSFRAGAATNIEVIDAERTARDADLAVVNAEDQLRRARLDLLKALGRFP